MNDEINNESEDIINQLIFNALINNEPVLLILPIKRNYDKYIIDPCSKR